MTDPDLAFVLTDPVALPQLVALLVLLTSAGTTAQEDRSGNPT